MNLKSMACLFCQIVMSAGITIDNKFIFGVLNEFDMHHPTMLSANWLNESATTILLMKNLFLKGQYCRMISPHQNVQNIDIQSQNVLTFSEEFEDVIEVFKEAKDNAESLVFVASPRIVEDVNNSR